jgi:3-phosphoshikimate 1-carboxyvinyltransferase
MRFLTALVSLGDGRYQLDGITRMRERPLTDLLDAIRHLGVRVRSLRNDGYPPVQIEPSGSGFSSPNWTLRSVRLRATVSSQFLSGLLMVSPLSVSPIRIQVSAPVVSEPYVRMTVDMMRLFGAVTASDYQTYFESSQIPWYQNRIFEIDPDATAASYFLAAAAINGGEITLEGFGRGGLQGDIRFVMVLNEMNCRIKESARGVSLQGFPLRGIDVDMNDISDCVPTLAAVACFAEGPTTIRNVAHIRHKESDRIAALATELRKVGAEVDEFPDGLSITPRPLHGAEIETYNDHRIAMSMALIGLKVPGIVIKNPGCVAKTYPGFWDDLDQLRR